MKALAMVGLVVGLLMPCVGANASSVSAHQYYLMGRDIRGFVLNHLPFVRRVWLDQVCSTRLHSHTQYSIVGNTNNRHGWLTCRDYFGRFQFSVQSPQK
jgi:hypothetical protein